MLDFSKLPLRTKVKERSGNQRCIIRFIPQTASPRRGTPASAVTIVCQIIKGNKKGTGYYTQWGKRTDDDGEGLNVRDLDDSWIEIQNEKKGEKPHDLSCLPAGTTFKDGYGRGFKIVGATTEEFIQCVTTGSLGITFCRSLRLLRNPPLGRRRKSDAVLSTITLGATTPSTLERLAQAKAAAYDLSIVAKTEAPQPERSIFDCDEYI